MPRTANHTKPADAADRPEKPRRGKRWLRRAIVAVLVGIALLVGGALAMLSPLAGVVLRPQLATQLGVDVRGGSLRLTTSGDIEISNATFVVPNGRPGIVIGDAARVLTVRRGVITLDWRGRSGGGPLVERVDLFDAVVRVSKPLDRFDLNILDIRPPAGGAGGPLPSVVVHRADLVLAEHDGTGDMTTLRELPITATLSPSADRTGAYDIELREDATRSTSAQPIKFAGMLRPDGFSGRVGALDIADFGPETIPLQLRELYTELRLAGRTRGARVFYDETTDVLEVVLDVRGGGSPAPFAEDAATPARLELHIPAPVDEAGTLRALIPASGSGTVRLVQRPAPRGVTPVPWQSVQATPEPGEPGVGTRRLYIEGDLDTTIEDLACDLDFRIWLGGGEPLYSFGLESRDEYAFTPDAPFFDVDNEILGKLGELFEDLGVEGGIEFAASAAQVADGAGTRQIVEGSGLIRRGKLRYAQFPYPVMDVDGLITIRGGIIELQDVQGRTPAGSPVAASGRILLDEEATGVDLTIEAFSAPFDQTLRETLDAVSPAIREIVMNEAALAERREAGLLRAPGSPGASAPFFELGGDIDATVRVVREKGRLGSTSVLVEASSERFGLLPEAFPVPLIARDVVVRVDLPPEYESAEAGEPQMLEVTAPSGTISTLSGGRASIDLSVRVPLGAEELSTAIDLEVDARGVPVSPLLIEAIPEPSEPGSGTPSPRRLLTRLDPAGPIDATVAVGRSHRARVDWRAEVRPDRVELRPPALDPTRDPIRLVGTTGVIRVDEDGLTGDLRAACEDGGGITTQLRVDNEEKRVLAVVSSVALNLQAHVEDVIALFSPDLANQLDEERRLYHIEGAANLTASVLSTPERVGAEVRISQLRDVRFDWLGGRLELDDSRGAIIVNNTDQGPIARFERLVAQGAYNGEPSGRFRLHGSMPFGALQEAGSLYPDPTALEIEVQGGSIEGPLFRTLVGDRIGEAGAEIYEEFEPTGEYDAMVALRTAGYAGGEGVRSVRSFELSPYDLEFTRRGVRHRVPWISGLLTGDEQPSPDGTSLYRGLIDDLTLGGDGWWIGLDGQWKAEDNGAVFGATTLEGELAPPPLDAEGRPVAVELLPEPLLALQLDAVAASIRGLELARAGPLSLPPSRLEIETNPERPVRVDLDLRLEAPDLRVGSRATGAAGAGDGDADDDDAPPNEEIADGRGAAAGAFGLRRVAARRQAGTSEDALPGSASPAINQARTHLVRVLDAAVGIRVRPDEADEVASIEVHASRGEIRGIAAMQTRTHAVVRPGGRIEFPHVLVGTSGGRVTGTAMVQLGAEPGDPVGYEIDATGAGLKTERVIAGLQDRPAADLASAGDMDIALGLSGRLGSPDTLMGRGSLRIRGGSPVDLPLPIRAAIEALNVQVGGARYDEVNGEFHIVGPTMSFSHLTAGSDAVVLSGLGTVDLIDGRIALDITSVPRNDSVVQATLRALRDVIVAVELGGTLSDPQTRPRPQALTGPFDRLRQLLQGGLTAEEWRRERLRRFARQGTQPDSGW
ncbi:MAG: AsmA-like C-terminal region-containing protein [Planctomycetota bacterium]